MTKCLVTGGAGFIGSHIADLLVQEGHHVLIVDDLSHGSLDNVNPEAQFISLDIRDEKLLDLLKGVDYVFHSAAQVNVQTSLQDPLEDASVNILGTINLLVGCRRAGVKKVIYSSSAAVYGEPQYLPVDEKHLCNPLSGYGISKLTAEKYMVMYSKLFGLDFTILRYANVYGPRQDASAEGGVIAIFIEQLRSGLAPVIFGDGRQTRDFIFVKDVAAANLAAMGSGAGEIVNISTGCPTTINEMYQTVRKLSRCDLNPEFQPAKPGDISHSYLDNTGARAKLGWDISYSFRAGLELTVDR